MAQKINLKKGNLSKPSYLGFSWTVLFFRFFVPFTRGDAKWGFIMLSMLFVPFASVVFAFVYNKIYTRKLLEEGWVPADKFSKKLLLDKGLILPKNGYKNEFITLKNAIDDKERIF